MARVPMKLNKKSAKIREVTVIVFIDGEEYTQTTKLVEEWAIPHVAFSITTQLDDPDYEGAEASRNS